MLAHNHLPDVWDYRDTNCQAEQTCLGTNGINADAEGEEQRLNASFFPLLAVKVITQQSFETVDSGLLVCGEHVRAHLQIHP